MSGVVKEVISEVLRKAVENFLTITVLIVAGDYLSTIVPSDDPIWTLYTGIGTAVSVIIVMLIQVIYALYAKVPLGALKLMKGDWAGLWIAFLAIYLIYSV